MGFDGVRVSEVSGLWELRAMNNALTKYRERADSGFPIVPDLASHGWDEDDLGEDIFCLFSHFLILFFSSLKSITYFFLSSLSQTTTPPYTSQWLAVSWARLIQPVSRLQQHGSPT